MPSIYCQGDLKKYWYPKSHFREIQNLGLKFSILAWQASGQSWVGCPNLVKTGIWLKLPLHRSPNNNIFQKYSGDILRMSGWQCLSGGRFSVNVALPHINVAWKEEKSIEHASSLFVRGGIFKSVKIFATYIHVLLEKDVWGRSCQRHCHTNVWHTGGNISLPSPSKTTRSKWPFYNWILSVDS